MKKKSILSKIILFPANFIKYICLGIFFVCYAILSIPFNIVKYFFKGIIFIISIFTLPFNKRSREHLKNKKVSGKTINSQAEIDKIFENKKKEKEAKKLKLENKNKKKEKALEEKKLKKERILEQKRLKKEKAEAKRKEKEEKREKIKALKEQKRLDKKEAKLSKRRKNEDYVNDNYKNKKPKVESSIKTFFHNLNNLPELIKKRFQNSLFYKNAKNKRDQNRQILLLNFDGEDAVKSEQKQMYQYVGKNADGKIVKDYFPAFSRVEVHSFLLSEGYEVYSIKTSKWINLFHNNIGKSIAKFKTKDLIFFLTQLSTYVKAGIPLVEALKILARQFKNKSYQKLFRAMIYDLTMGESFSSSMDKQGNAFPKLLINMVKTSEMTGELPEVLDDMADYYTEMDRTRKQMITALTYPTIVFIFALAVITFILLYVVPKFVDIYKDMENSQIPSFTIFVMNFSAFLQNNIIIIFIAIVGILLLLVFLYKNIKAARSAMQWIVMHIPIIKNIIIYKEVATFTKTFSSLLRHNVFVTDSLEILSKITNNEIYKMLVRDTAANLERGGKISDAYKDQWAFPIPAYEMIVTGERTGQLAEMMQKVSTYYQELHTNTVTRIKTFIEPILIIFLTVVVGFIVLAVIVPMFNMYNQVLV